jgi:hypothetical protein
MYTLSQSPGGLEKINSKRFYGTPNPFFLPFPCAYKGIQVVSTYEIDNVWLKERHALDLYQSASACIPWSPGDACKLVYSSFPCVLFCLNGLAPSMSWKCMWHWTLCVCAFVYRTPCTELWSPFLRIFVKWQTCSPLHLNKGQWRAPSAAPQAAMLLTLSTHCLLTKQPRPETDAIGHRSPFCEQFLTEWAFTTKPICFNHPGTHAAAYLPSCFCKDKWRSLGGTEAKWRWVLL